MVWIDQRPHLSADAPASVSPDEEIELSGTLINPEREKDGLFTARDVRVCVSDLPDGFESKNQTETTFDTIAEGASEAVRWTVAVDGDTVNLGVYEFAVEASLTYTDETITVTDTDKIRTNDT